MKIIKLISILLILVNSSEPISASSVNQDSIIVASDGSGDFLTIQSAIYSADNYSTKRIIIFLKPGVYNEKVKIPFQKTNISLIGSSPEKTIITNSDYSGKKREVPDEDGNPKFRTFTSYTLRVEGSNFTAENITIVNTAGEVGQAVSLHIDGDKAAFINCRIKGHQDTLYISKGGGRTFFSNCYISGTTDFIFGAGIALFEECEIVSIRNSYITAAATPEHEPYGFIFKECHLKPLDESVDQVYLGRPWRPYAKTIYIDCYMEDHIKPEGWDNWRKESNEKTATYSELHTNGPGAQGIPNRVIWSNQLKEEDRSKYDFDLIFKGWRPNFVTSSTKDFIQGYPIDSSYNQNWELKKIKKKYPNARIAEDLLQKGVKEQRNIVYSSVDNTSFGKRDLHLDIFYPEKNGNYPVVLMIHGGGWRSGNKEMLVPLAQRLARKGYVAITIEYQLSLEAPYPAALHNIKSAVRWVRLSAERYKIDSAKMAIAGGSAGGHLAALVGMTNGVQKMEGSLGNNDASSDVGAVIDIDGVLNFISPTSLNKPRSPYNADIEWLGGSFEEVPAFWKEASPVFWVNEKSVPILFINSGFPRFHAGQDEMKAKLEQYGVINEVKKLDIEVHPFWLFEPWIDKTVKYIDDFLKKVF